MLKPTHRSSVLLSLPLVLFVASCGSSDGGEAETVTTTAESADASTDTAPETDGETATASAAGGLDVSLFFDGALADEVTTEDCTLDGGAEATCYSITVAGYPASHDIGPFCPDTTSDGADAGGLWLDGDDVYDLDGQFFVDLPTLYGDDGWQMYDEDGNIFVTETAEEFEAAARPDVDPDLYNHCIEGQVDWLENGEPITTTALIPTVPVAADSAATSQGNSGITLDGVVIAESAPVELILGAYTIAAFDDCGAHFNPFEGYHMHGAVGCSEVGETTDGETPIFGYAMDGYAVRSPLDDADVEAAGLDECNGHTTETDGYHYHANSAAENQVVECLVGQSVAGDDAGGPPGGDGAGRPDGPPPADG